MRTLSRALARWEMPRLAGATLGIAWLVLLVAFVAAATAAPPRLGAVLAAISAAAIAAAAILYAWREPGP